MLHLIIFLTGFILNKILNIIFRKSDGKILVDEKNNLCKIKITTDKLSNLKTKYVMFDVEHGCFINTDESRENNIL